jgi:hypothetical protein
VGIDVEVLETPGGKRRRSTDEAVHDAAFFEEELGEK